MTGRTVAVLGGGVAGLGAALALARDGHHVSLFERDSLETGDPAQAPAWDRRGIPHFLQPHAFIPRGRAELRALFPDVYDRLLAVGAYDVDVRRKCPGPAMPDDDDLQYLAVRRPVLEWALRTAVLAEDRIETHGRLAVTGLRVDAGRVTGVRAGSTALDADLVIDAMGRRTPTPGWLDDAGCTTEPAESSDCGVVYFSRYYRQRAGFELPDGPWLLSPRGDLGYVGYASFPGDDRTFAAILAAPSGVPEWRAFNDPDAFESAIAHIPALRSWVDPDGVDPITDVLPMAGLRNSIRHFDPSAAIGLVPTGDAYCHTDPTLAHGLAFALVHAHELMKALRAHDDVGDAGLAYREATLPELRERYDLATALDDQRLRRWLGENVDFAHHDRGAYALFSIVVAGAAALADADVFPVAVRRIGLLDRTSVLDDDVAMQKRIEDVFAELTAAPRPAAGPGRDEMVTIVERARFSDPVA
jgi:2-polyprenyl-6-methoxyphenol hydroxylase-like FAD-dependent oxidoreductase